MELSHKERQELVPLKQCALRPPVPTKVKDALVFMRQARETIDELYATETVVSQALATAYQHLSDAISDTLSAIDSWK